MLVSFLQKLFSMGGYALYVWPAYAAVLLLLFLNAYRTISQLRKQMHHVTHEKKYATEAQKTDIYSY